jgi:hypothetical protein
VRRQAQQPASLPEAFSDEADVTSAEIPKSAVHEPRRTAAGAGSEVALLDEADRKASQGSVERYPRPCDATADNDEIERFFAEVL